MGRCILMYLGVKHHIYILFSGCQKENGGGSSLYYLFYFSVGLKFFNNNNKPMRVYQELKVSRNETDTWRGRRRDKNTTGIGNSMCKGLEGKESLLPETTSKSIFLRKLYIWGKEGVVESLKASKIS